MSSHLPRVVTLLLGAMLFLAQCGGDSAGTEGAAPPGTTGPALAEEVPAVGVDTLPPVALDEPADFGEGLRATVTSVELIQLEAQAPTDTTGPGVAVTVEVLNDTGAALDLAGLVVNLRLADGSPASPSSSPPADWPSGSLADGERTTGVYAFRIRPEAGPSLVEVHHNTSPNIMTVEL